LLFDAAESNLGRQIKTAAERVVMPTTQVNGLAVASTSGSAATVPIEPSWYINRELSWLDFNERVLE
jgi:hypothetical protein